MAIIKDGNTYTVRCWYKTWKGESKQKVKRGFEKLKDAKKWERDFLSTEHSQALKMSTLIKLFEDNMKNQIALGKLRETTVLTKQVNINHYIKDYFGDASTDNITTAVINQWLGHINKNNGRGERLSSGTVKIVRNLLSQIFEYGRKYQGLKFNPVKDSDKPEPYSTDERADMWEIDEYKRFYESLDNIGHKALFNTLYWAGLRIGELLALTPADIQDGSIIINKSWVYIIKDKRYSFKPKRAGSIRTIAVPLFLTEQLKDYISTIDGIKPTDRIFPYDRSTPDHLLKYKIDKLGLPCASLHTMRHSYISNILAETKDIAVAAAQSGDTPTTIFRHYTHSIKKSVENAVQSLEKLHQN